jgi:hypothetical protein
LERRKRSKKEGAMPKYALLIYNPVEGGPTPEELAEHHPRWIKYEQELKDAGMLLDTQGRRGPEAATTVRVRDGETQITDGPFAETKELLAGFFFIEADTLDTALEQAAHMPNVDYGAVEVRPLWG